MIAVRTKKKSMTITQIRTKAKSLGIKHGKMTKTMLIHAIQTAEGNSPCFGTAQNGCQYSDCCFMQDCL